MRFDRIHHKKWPFFLDTRVRWSSVGDSKYHQITLQIDELKVGGNGWAVAIVILLLAVLVVLIIYVTGHRIVLESEK